MKTKTRKTPSVGLTLLKSSCVKRQVSGYESELSSHTPASCHTTDVVQARRRKTPASLKNHFSQYIAVMSGCAAGFLGFSSEDVFSCAATSDVVRACAGACSQAQSHDSSTGLEELKHQQRGFQGFC
jgi:hypothetical protein